MERGVEDCGLLFRAGISCGCNDTDFPGRVRVFLYSKYTNCIDKGNIVLPEGIKLYWGVEWNDRFGLARTVDWHITFILLLRQTDVKSNRSDSEQVVVPISNKKWSGWSINHLAIRSLWEIEGTEDSNEDVESECKLEVSAIGNFDILLWNG
jgi:hypothetical protein